MRTSLCVLSLLLFACPPQKKYEPPPSGRCDIDFEQYKFANVGNGASAEVGNEGGASLQNDRVQVQLPGHSIVVGDRQPFGGTLKAAGFGSLVLNYASGRTMKEARADVLEDGGAGGYVVVAATGVDALNDTFNLHREADTELPLLLTTYFVLSPGESRVRVLTAFCNQSKDTIETTVGDVIDFGDGAVFNAGGCANGFGTRACGADSSKWLAAQNGTQAFGYRAYSLNDSQAPATMHVEPVGSAFMTSLGGFGILPGDKRVFVRDFFVGKDISEISSTMLALDSAGKSRVTITLQYADGSPAHRGAINVKRAETGETVTIAFTGDDGVAKFDLPPGNYLVGAGAQGSAIEPFKALTVPSNGTAEATIKYGASNALNINLTGARPVDLIARCANPPCPFQAADYRAFQELADQPADVQLVRSPLQAVTEGLPPGEYELELSHGPRVSKSVQAIDLRTGDQSITGVITQAVPARVDAQTFPLSTWELGDFGLNTTPFVQPQGLRLDQLFTELHQQGDTITLLTPRATLAALKVDTATGQSHVDAGFFRMEPADTLFSFDFDAMTVDSVAELNDWMTFLSNGHPKRLVQLRDQPLVTLTANVGDGGVISVPSGTPVDFTVEVQAADWVQFDSLELHTEAPGRESVNGVANDTFVPASAQLTKTYNPAALPSDGGVVHVTETFTVTVTNSTWFVAVVRGTGASQPIDSLTGARVFAVTNAVRVDAQ